MGWLPSFLSWLALINPSRGSATDQQVPFRPPQSSIDRIPPLGFGTWNLKVSPENTTNAVSAAIETGYLHVDCAKAYGNQIDVGRGIKEGLTKTGRKREDIWITSKLWNDHHSPDRVEEALKNTLQELGLDYLDLYLMHWPVGKDPRASKYEYDYVTTWHAMEKLLDRGTVRYIGVCNFSPHQLETLIGRSKIKPAVHQFESHPYLQQTDWVDFHRAHGIDVTAYSPLGDTNPIYRSHFGTITSWLATLEKRPPPLLENKVINAIAKERGCTAAQVALAWGMARGTAVIPKSSHVSYIRENFAAQSCPLSVADMARITLMEKKWVKRFNNPSKSWGVKLFEGLDGVSYVYPSRIL